MVEFGRHERLKISWLHGRAGSSPALRTNEFVPDIYMLIQPVDSGTFSLLNAKVVSNPVANLTR